MGLIYLLALVPATLTSAAELIDPSEVSPGTTGVCLTEMDGGELVEIPITVLGTTGPTAPEGEIVLIRLEDERFSDTGIIAGMSGSPVYIEGRLLGALAFGWAFAREPIGGVTPFTRMQYLASTSDSKQVHAGGAGIRPTMLHLLEASQEPERLGQELLQWLIPEPRDELPRLPLAMSIAGLPASGNNGWLAEAWRRLGWARVSAPAGVDPSIEGPLYPGASMAAVLIDGDASFTAGGTVTEVRGDQVWALGHPFLGGGACRLPLASARVITVMPSFRDSFKFMNVGTMIGALEMDRKHGVWGRLGQSVPMIPITVNASGHIYHFRSVRHPVILPVLTAFLTESSHTARGGSFGQQTVAVRAQLDYAGLSPVVIEETYAGGDAPSMAASLVSLITAYLEGSSFEPAELQSLKIDLHAGQEITTTEVIDAVPERTIVRPGEALGVRVRLRSHHAASVTERRLTIMVPGELAAGRIDLIVAAGGSWTQYDLRMRPFKPASFSDEAQLVRRLRPSTRLVAALERFEVGVALQGGHLAAPPSVVLALRSGLGANLGVTAFRVVQLIEEEMPYPVVGALRVPLEVRVDGPEAMNQTAEDS